MPLRDGVRQHAVDPHHRQRERQRRERADERRVEPRLGHRRRHSRVHRHHLVERQLRIDRENLASDRSHEGERIAPGADDERGAESAECEGRHLGNLAIRHVGLRLRLAVEAGRPDVTGHADDLPVLAAEKVVQAPADG